MCKRPQRLRVPISFAFWVKTALRKGLRLGNKKIISLRRYAAGGKAVKTVMINKKYKSGERELGTLALNLLSYKLFTGMPRVYFTEAGCAAYLAAILSVLFFIIILILVLRIYQRLDANNITDAAERVFGAFGRYAACAFVAVYICLSFVYALREFSGLVRFLAFPTAPAWFVSAFFAVAVLAACKCGINTVIRAHSLIVPAAIGVTLFMLASVLRFAETESLFPFLGNGVSKILGGGLKGVSAYSDIILLFLVNPFAADSATLKRSAAKAAAVAVVLNILFVIICTAVIPFRTLSESAYPICLLLKEVYYGRFFQRIDALYMLTASLCGMLYLSFSAVCLTYTIKQAFGMKDKSPLAAPMVSALYLASLADSVFGVRGTYNAAYTAAYAVFAVLTAVAFGSFLKKGRLENEKV